MTVHLQCLPPIRTLSLIEVEIVTRAVVDILTAGCDISVNDGEETVLKHSDNLSEILQAMFSTESDALIVTRDLGSQRERVGVVDFIYGNGWDVIHDYSDTLNDMLRGALITSEALAMFGAGAEQWLKEHPSNLFVPAPRIPKRSGYMARAACPHYLKWAAILRRVTSHRDYRFEADWTSRRKVLLQLATFAAEQMTFYSNRYWRSQGIKPQLKINRPKRLRAEWENRWREGM